MKRTIILLGTILCGYSCADHSKKISADVPKHMENEGAAHWSYHGETGPSHWSEIEADSDCNGQKQSPINIIDIDVIHDSELRPIVFNYASNVKIHDVTNNGHSIQYNFEKGDNIELGNKTYELIQIHFHEPSEHTINGVRYPIETHMVHIDENGKVVVLAIFGEEGADNEVFEFLEGYLPIQVGETKMIDDYLDFNLNLPDNRSYYNYQGSLTTPPCTEDVDWYVFKTPITLSVDQVKQLQKLMPLNNYRNEQPINDRKVRSISVKNILQ